MQSLEIDESLEKAAKLTDINAVVTVNERAEAEANAVARRGLTPIPIVIKDIIYTKGLRTTMGSRVFRDYVPREDAAVVARLRRAGFVIIGKSNAHEFASGATTTSSVFGPTRNPLDKDRIAGGSSGGSAAAVAAGIVEVAIGTDTAGSVRIPASLCGVFGFRPTSGSTPKAGVFPLAPTFDEVGVIASNLDVLRRALQAIMVRRRKARPIRGQPRLAVPRGLLVADRDVSRAFWDLAARLNAAEVDLPIARARGRESFTVIRLSEASSVHLPFRDRWQEYFPDVRRLLERGLEFKATDYATALEVMRRVKDEFTSVMRKFDAMILPSTAIPAPRIDEVLGKEDGPVRDLLTGNSWLAPLVGAPAISVPMFKVNGLPVGLQLIGRPGEDLELLELAERILSL
ncbi:amidase [Acidilobus saccharovorans]|uniref:amidase n=1 Tax=Acidilobus saccharovorans TaxID=242703 RepID=UPI0011D123A0|nr:amidase [Acidilobus saccharovorans]